MEDVRHIEELNAGARRAIFDERWGEQGLRKSSEGELCVDKYRGAYREEKRPGVECFGSDRCGEQKLVVGKNIRASLEIHLKGSLRR